MRGRARFILQIALLVSLYVIDAFSDALFLDVVALVLIVGPTASITVAVILKWTAGQAPDIVSLRERADDAVTLALASLGFAIAGASVVWRALGFVIPGRPVVVLLGYGAMLVLVPGIVWMGTWRSVWLPLVRKRKEEP